MRRRALLAGATAGILGGSYVARNHIAPSGRITRRAISGVTTTSEGNRTAEDIVRELIVETDPINVVVYIHEAFRDVFTTDQTNTVDTAVHERLTDRYEEVQYFAEHFRESGDPGERPSATPRLSRPSFNKAVIAADVRMVYHLDPWATVVWQTAPPEEVTLRPHPEMAEEA